MTKAERIEAALEIFSSSESIKEMGVTVSELVEIRERIGVAIAEMERAALRMGLYEANGRQFKEPIKGMASPELQAEIELHNDYTGDEITKSDCLIKEINE